MRRLCQLVLHTLRIRRTILECQIQRVRSAIRLCPYRLSTLDRAVGNHIHTVKYAPALVLKLIDCGIQGLLREIEESITTSTMRKSYQEHVHGDNKIRITLEKITG